MRAGAADLRLKVARYSPGVVCFLGKDIYRWFACIKPGTPVHYGPVSGKGILPGVIEFVASNPSGRSTVPFAGKLSVFRQIKDIVCRQ